MTSALLLALLGCAADKDTEETGLESEVCDDGSDNDGDGLVDCEDADCVSAETCSEDCSDGEDNDLDGLVDCEDADCASDLACIEDCEDELDNDLDGFVDCEDDDCWGTDVCEMGAQVLSSGRGGRAIRRVAHTTTTYRPGSGYTYNYGIYANNSAAIEDIEGTLRMPLGSAEVTCNWSVDLVFMARTLSATSSDPNGFNSVYQKAFGMDLVLRDGFKTSGACGGVGSEVLPTKFGWDWTSGIGATDQSSVSVSSFVGPLWYAANMGLMDITSFSSTRSGTTSGGYYTHYRSSGVDYKQAWPEGGPGEVWNP